MDDDLHHHQIHPPVSAPFLYFTCSGFGPVFLKAILLKWSKKRFPCVQRQYAKLLCHITNLWQLPPLYKQNKYSKAYQSCHSPEKNVGQECAIGNMWCSSRTMLLKIFFRNLYASEDISSWMTVQHGNKNPPKHIEQTGKTPSLKLN